MLRERNLISYLVCVLYRIEKHSVRTFDKYSNKIQKCNALPNTFEKDQNPTWIVSDFIFVFEEKFDSSLKYMVLVWIKRKTHLVTIDIIFYTRYEFDSWPKKIYVCAHQFINKWGEIVLIHFKMQEKQIGALWISTLTINKSKAKHFRIELRILSSFFKCKKYNCIIWSPFGTGYY